jgi:hypothetical protein
MWQLCRALIIRLVSVRLHAVEQALLAQQREGDQR